MWKDFFYFTKTERQGILVLFVLVIGAFTAPFLFHFFYHPEPNEHQDGKRFEKEYNEFIASLKDDSRKTQTNPKVIQRYPPKKKREIKLSAFDPNTADSITFYNLGLPSWMIRNILNYRRKKGKFRRPEDFRKIYGLTEEQYQTLRPFIQIAETAPYKDTTALYKDTVQLLMAYEQRRDTLVKYQPGTIIELNEADTTELKKIPGIGSAIARMIVNYRNRLGAYYRIEQLQEIHLKAEKLRPWFSIDTKFIRPIHINKASVQQMMRHPYINFYQARAIVEYRKKNGNLKSLKDLAFYEEFSPADLERLAPYICIDK